MRVFFSQINTCTSRQQSRSPSLLWGASSNQLKAWTEQRAETVLLARSSSCLARCPSWLISPVLPLNSKLKKISSSWVSNHLAFQLLFTDSVLHQHASAQVFGIQLECHCGLQKNWDSLERSWNLLASISHEQSHYKSIHAYTQAHTYPISSAAL